MTVCMRWWIAWLLWAHRPEYDLLSSTIWWKNWMTVWQSVLSFARKWCVKRKILFTFLTTRLGFATYLGFAPYFESATYCHGSVQTLNHLHALDPLRIETSTQPKENAFLQKVPSFESKAKKEVKKGTANVRKIVTVINILILLALERLGQNKKPSRYILICTTCLSCGCYGSKRIICTIWYVIWRMCDKEERNSELWIQIQDSLRNTKNHFPPGQSNCSKCDRWD